MPMQNLEQILASLRQGTEAEAALPTLNAEMAEAKALRGKPLASVDEKTGYVSPFEAMTGMIQQGRAAKQRRELTPQIAQANQQMAASKAGMQEHTLRQAMDKIQTQKNQHAATALAKTTAANQQNTWNQEAAENQVLERADIAANKLEDDAVIAEKGHEYRMAELEAQKKDPKAATFSDYDQYEDENGNIYHVSKKSDGTTHVSDVDGQPVQRTIQDLKKYEEDETSKKYKQNNKERFAGMTNDARRDVTAANLAIRDVNDINKVVEKLTTSDIAILSENRKIFQTMMQEGWLPSSLNTFIQGNGRDLSPTAKEYMTKMQKFSGKIRNKLYGSALTAAEIKLSDLWLPSATGLNVEDAMGRTSGIIDGVLNTVYSIDDTYGRDFMSTMPERYTYKTKEQQAAQDNEADAVKLKGIQDEIAALRAKETEEG